MRKKIMIIEENSQKYKKLLRFFDPYFSVNYYINGLQGLISAMEWKPNVVIINHSLVSVNSLELCRQIHQQLKTTIVIIGEPLMEEQIINYYQAGADEVYVQPISYSILHCKINALLNKEQFNKREEDEEDCEFEKLIMSKNDHKIYYDKKELNFTRKEFSILWILAKQRDTVVKRQDLLKYVWSSTDLEDNRMIDTHINRIRKKLKQNHISVTIKTIWGTGYRLQSEGLKELEPIKMAVAD